MIRGSRMLLNMSRDDQKLQEAKFELIMSEASYLRSLNVAVDHFQRSSELQALLSNQERQWLFSRLQEVRDVSASFLFDLEEKFEENMFTFNVCDVALRHAPEFRKVYLPYVTNQTYQDQIFQRLLTENARFQQVLERLESATVCQRLSLKSFLILPFQRITRLKLLLQNILKRTPPESDEEVQATQAYDALEKLIKDCNENVQRMKSTEELIYLSQKIDFECKIFPLVSQSRRLVKCGELMTLDNNTLSPKWKLNTRPIYLHLFNDRLLLSRPRDSEKLRWISALAPPRGEPDLLESPDSPQVQCIRTYKARENDELALEKADIIMVMQNSNDVGEEEQQEQGGEASPLSTKHFIADVAHGPGNSLLSTFHTVIVKDESESILEAGCGADPLKEEEEDENYCMVQVGGSPNLHPPALDCQPGSILETRDGADSVKEEDGGGNYCMVHVSGSPTLHPPALDCQLNYATMCGSLPAFFGNMNSVPQVPGAEFTQEIPDQSQERAEGYYPDSTEKETKKQKISGSSGMCSPKTSSVAPGDFYSLAQLQDVNLNLGHATRRSARCAAASTAGQQSYRVSSFQESGGGQDVAKEKKVPPENPEEQGALPPVRKKTRTFYSAEQLEELERMFQEDHYPDNEKRREIAAAVGVTPQRIMVWFQNRRAKWRKLEKLTVKGSKKCTASTTLSIPSGASTYGPSLLPMPTLPDIIHDQSAMLNMDTTVGNYPSMLSGHPAPLVCSSVSSVTGVVTCCEAGQTKALSQGSFGSSRMECFPTIPSPPPIRRASLPLNMTFNPNNHIVPLMLDTPNSECSPSSQESSSREVLTYSFQSQGYGQ
ncbi:Rho guanine nucleotide exchange factor 5 [Chelonia mydas]|uniref:Rho guanine nucleotide exchange factor 5 n=1 Tax=Chelonia mydas TaxID=8469 RepID=M7CCH6_CHEMY|nr:Rho guanine nucleotide exchange factor 5 [Chelonia mydas]